MKANSNDNPGQYTKSKGKLYYNYNITESIKEDEHGTRTVFDYDYVEVKSKDKADILKAIIRDTYSIEDEIALINNNTGGKPEHIAEYLAYAEFRRDAKTIAAEATE